MGTFLNLPDTRALLGVDSDKKAWESCDSGINRAFHAALDQTGKTWLYVEGLLERGVRVLNYVGTLDWSKWNLFSWHSSPPSYK
jgi:cathepsin A (carboxypeptidase C)